MSLSIEDLQAISELMDGKLRPIDSRLDTLQEDISGLKTDVSDLKTDVSGLKTDMVEVKDRLLGIELVQENQILPHFRLLAEGHTGIVERLGQLDELRDRVEDLNIETKAIKLAVIGRVRK